MVSATEIFTVDIREISRTEIDAAYFSMSGERRKKCDSLRLQSDRDLCIASDMLLRRVLSEKTGISPTELSFVLTERGKPCLENGGYHFSISHSGDIAAVAVNKEKAVGIDVEKIRPVSARIAERFFSQTEKAFIFGNGTMPEGNTEDKELLTRFFTVWTYKEAYVKMTGEGITDNFRDYSYDAKNCITRIFDEYVLSAVTSE